MERIDEVSTPEEIMGEYTAETQIVTIDEAGKKRFKIRKFDPLNQCVLQVLSLPDYAGKDVPQQEVKDAAVKLMNDPANRPELMKQAIISCTVEPPIVAGMAKKEGGKYINVSYEAMDPTDKLLLLGKIFEFSGFSGPKEKFFPKAAGARVAGPGSASEPLRDAATQAAGAAG